MADGLRLQKTDLFYASIAFKVSFCYFKRQKEYFYKKRDSPIRILIAAPPGGASLIVNQIKQTLNLTEKNQDGRTLIENLLLD